MNQLSAGIKIIVPKFIKQPQQDPEKKPGDDQAGSGDPGDPGDPGDEGGNEPGDGGDQSEGGGSGGNKPGKSGKSKPGKPGDGKPDQTGTSGKSDSPGETQPGGNKPGQASKPSDHGPEKITVITPRGVDEHVHQDPTQAKQQPPGTEDAVMPGQPSISDHKPISEREIEQAIQEAGKEVGDGKDIPATDNRSDKEVVGPPGSGKSASRMSRELFDKLKGTTTDWKELLKRYIGSGKPTGSEETYRKLRKWSYGSYSPMPVSKPGIPALKILVAIDTSMSITKKMIYSFMCEVNKMVKTIPNATVHVILWDDEVDAVYVNVTQKDIDKIGPPAQPGGTSASCVKRWIDKHPRYASNLSCVIYLTDMEFYDSGGTVFPKAPIIFCVPVKLYSSYYADRYKKNGKIIKVGV